MTLTRKQLVGFVVGMVVVRFLTQLGFLVYDYYFSWEHSWEKEAYFALNSRGDFWLTGLLLCFFVLIPYLFYSIFALLY